MCGIVYKESFDGKPVNQAIKQIYKNQRHRGIEGFGFYIPTMGRMAHNTREKRILSLLNKKQYQSERILFHHRFPTSTDNVQNACHPFSTRRNNSMFANEYVLVHNGHVSNASSLKIKHEALGIEYVSTQQNGEFNDSEALLYDVALYLEGKQEKLEAKGAIAFIVTSGDNLYFGRNEGSPLKYDLSSRSLKLSSEGAGEMIAANKLYQFDRERKVFTLSDLEIPDSWAYTPSTTYPTRWDDDDILDTGYDSMIRRLEVTSGQQGLFGKHHPDIRVEGYQLIDFFGQDINQALEFAEDSREEAETALLKMEEAAKANGSYSYIFNKDYEELETTKRHWTSVVAFLWEAYTAEPYYAAA